jgi:hypothetical protein
LVERRFKSGLPGTREEYRELLKNGISQELYDLALARNLVPRVQTRRPIIGWFGERPLDRTAPNIDAFRPATALELRRYWAHRFAHWELEFLKRQKAQLAAVTAVRPGTSRSDRVGRRGPKPSIHHYDIAAIVRRRGTAWRAELALEAICEELDERHIPLPTAWAKWQPRSRSWRRALQNQKRLVIKQLEYSLQMAPS